MRIIELSLDQINEYENNPRANDMAVESVASSIREFGFKVPIVVDRDNVIVAGHTRVMAARSLGMEKVPAIVADDLSPEQVKAYRLADNKTAELADWDFSKLEEELLSIAEMDLSFEMADFGFEEPKDPRVGEGQSAPKEYDMEEFADEEFDHECPRCGFKFSEY